MTDHPNLDNMCRNLDRLMTVEARLSETSRDTIAKLYDAAVAKQGGPLSLRAARLVLAHAKPGRVALIVTGAGGHDFMPNGETDGPLGAVVLARAIHEATGAVPILLTDHHSRDSLEKTALAAGLGIRALDVVSQVAFTTHVVTLPPGEVDAAAIFEQLDPTLICSVERLGPARDGIAYNATGNPAAAKRAKVESLFDLAAERGIATFGTGDNGNEIGFGLIHAAVVAHKTYGERLGGGGVGCCCRPTPPTGAPMRWSRRWRPCCAGRNSCMIRRRRRASWPPMSRRIARRARRGGTSTGWTACPAMSASVS
jgi:D-glutamate cyclase